MNSSDTESSSSTVLADPGWPLAILIEMFQTVEGGGEVGGRRRGKEKAAERGRMRRRKRRYEDGKDRERKSMKKY